MLAATLSPSYGIYSGLRALENVPVARGSEEYLDSEKYEVKQRALDGPLLPLVRRLNEIRRAEPALQRFENLHLLDTHERARLRLRQGARDRRRRVNLDPREPARGRRHRPAGPRPARRVPVRDLLTRRALPLADRPQLRRLPPGGAHVMKIGCASSEVERPARRHWFESQPALVQDGRLLRDPHARVLRRQRRRLRRLPRPAAEARLPAVARDRLHLAAAVLSVAAAGRRLRHRGLLRDQPRLRHGRGLPHLRRGGARARDARHRRPRHEPHLRPTIRGSRSRAPTRTAPKATGTSGRTATSRTATRGSSSSTRRPRTGRTTRSRGQYYWHRFFSHQPDLNYESPAVQDAMLEVLRFWLDLGLDGFRLDAVPYLYEEEGTNCENLPRTHEYLKRVRAEVDANYPDRVLLGRGEPVAGGRGRVLRRRGRVPHGLPLPRDAAHVHVAAAGGGAADDRDPRPHAADPATTRSGASSSATTTS